MVRRIKQVKAFLQHILGTAIDDDEELEITDDYFTTRMTGQQFMRKTMAQIADDVIA